MKIEVRTDKTNKFHDCCALILFIGLFATTNAIIILNIDLYSNWYYSALSFLTNMLAMSWKLLTAFGITLTISGLIIKAPKLLIYISFWILPTILLLFSLACILLSQAVQSLHITLLLSSLILGLLNGFIYSRVLAGYLQFIIQVMVTVVKILSNYLIGFGAILTALFGLNFIQWYLAFETVDKSTFTRFHGQWGYPLLIQSIWSYFITIYFIQVFVSSIIINHVKMMVTRKNETLNSGNSRRVTDFISQEFSKWLIWLFECDVPNFNTNEIKRTAFKSAFFSLGSIN